MCRRQDHGFFSGRDGESGLVEVAFKACLVGFCVIWNSPWQRCDSMNLTHSNRFPDVHLPLSAFWGKSWRFSDDATTIQASTALWAFFALKIPQRFQLQPLRRRGTGGTNGTVGPCTMVGLLAMQGRCWAMVTALESGHLAVRSITWVNMYEPLRAKATMENTWVSLKAWYTGIPWYTNKLPLNIENMWKWWLTNGFRGTQFWPIWW